MNKYADKTLDDAVAATRELPQEVQTMVTQEVFEMIEDVTVTPRSADDQAIIKERLARPRNATSRDDFMAMLKQYNPSV